MIKLTPINEYPVRRNINRAYEKKQKPNNGHHAMRRQELGQTITIYGQIIYGKNMICKFAPATANK